MGILNHLKKSKNKKEINIKDLVFSSSWHDREYSISLIIQNPTSENLELLLMLLADNDWSVSKRAENAFLQLNTVGKYYLIEKGLTNEDKKIRIASYRILKKMGCLRDARLALAKYYEKTGNYEKSAELYEKVGKIILAKETRKKNREIHVYQKNINIEIDMNSILKYLRDHGETVKYTCPNCGAQLEIDGTKNMYYCPYCGTKIDVITLKDILDKML